ncbi:MAG: hypothetical protein RI900_1183 [Actinomycetota bacterium]
MRALPRIRLLFARRPWLRWLVIAACTAAVGAQLLATQSALERERSRWGTSRAVWVAEADTVPGGPLSARRVLWPEAVLPATVLHELPASPLAAREVAEGQLLTALDVVGDESTPPGWEVFAVPAEGLPRLAPSETIAVYSGGAGLCEGIATRSSSDGTVEVAVPPTCAAPFSAALAAGDLVVALRT